MKKGLLSNRIMWHHLLVKTIHVVTAPSSVVGHILGPPAKSIQRSLSHTHTRTHAHMHTHTHKRFTALWILSGTTRVSRYQKKHSPTHIYCGHQSSIICFIHLIQAHIMMSCNITTIRLGNKQKSNEMNVKLTGLTPARHASQNHGSVLAEDDDDALSTDSISDMP